MSTRWGSASQRFWANVEKTPTCWLWTAGTKGNGYGAFHDGRKTSAHRWSYEAAFGPIPAGMLVCHRCDVRGCVNPSHLFLGTVADNTHDMMAKGRGVSPPGIQNGRSKLTREQVDSILAEAASGRRYVHIAPEFGITGEYVGQLVSGKWRRSA